MEKTEYNKSISKIEDFMEEEDFDIDVQVRISNLLTKDYINKEENKMTEKNIDKELKEIVKILERW